MPLDKMLLESRMLKRIVGDQINVLMAAASFNYRKWIRVIYFWLQFMLALMRIQMQNEPLKA